MGFKQIIKDLFTRIDDSTITKITMSVSDAYDDPNTFNFDEDHYRQIEFLPNENFTKTSKTAEEITAFAEENFDTFGWWGSYIRTDAAFTTKSRMIPVEELSAIFSEKGYFEFKRVTKSESYTATVQHHTKAFKNNSIVICFNHKDSIVENIWLNMLPQKDDYPEFKRVLLFLCNKYKFLLADWWKSIIIDVSDPIKIDNWLET